MLLCTVLVIIFAVYFSAWPTRPAIYSVSMTMFSDISICYAVQNIVPKNYHVLPYYQGIH